MAQQHGERHSGEAITILRIEPITGNEAFALMTTAQGADGRLADAHSAYHDNQSPPLRWDAVPEAVAYALIVEDPDAPREQPFVHWLIWNIPGDATELRAGIPDTIAPPEPVGAVQGRNDAGTYGWYGPKPPAGHGVHHYYFQLFALTQTLDFEPDTPLEQIVNALKGLTLAKTELVATYEAPTEQ